MIPKACNLCFVLYVLNKNSVMLTENVGSLQPKTQTEVVPTAHTDVANINLSG